MLCRPAQVLFWYGHHLVGPSLPEPLRCRQLLLLLLLLNSLAAGRIPPCCP
jgi:hypothetical protein